MIGISLMKLSYHQKKITTASLKSIANEGLCTQKTYRIHLK